MSGIAFDGFDQVGDQVVAAFKLDVNVRPGIVAAHTQLHQAVVHPNQQHDDDNQNAQENESHERLP